jgi:hypothetical protein
MKQVYRCEYCDYMGTEDEVREHEIKCYWNYDRKSCWTCKHRDPNSLMRFKCLLGTEIADGCLIEFCGKYERDDDRKHSKTSSNIFRGFFGGL